MNVLIVDDEQLVLNGIRRALFNSGWKMCFADSGLHALEKMSKCSFDFVVTDMRMPGMDGAQLLEKISEKHPSCVRIMLSGYSDNEAAKRATFVAHQWFSKPCDPKKLEAELNRINEIRDSLPNKKVQDFVGHIKSLPSPPKIFMRIKASLKEESCDLPEIAGIINEDPSLCAKILQISNSSFFVHGVPATTLEAAITRLGLDVVCSVVLLAESFSKLDNDCGFSIEAEQQHSIATARLAKAIVETKYKEETMLAGLLHDIGKLILCKISQKAMHDYLSEREGKESNLKLERRLFEADHTQLAGYLLHLWNFPYTLIEAVVSHHSPEKLMTETFTPGAAIYVANQIFSNHALDENFIMHFGLKDKIIEWKALAKNLVA